MSRNKPRKWSNLQGQLPARPVEVSERFAKVIEEADSLRTHEDGTPFSMTDLQDEWVTLEEEEAFAKLQEYARNVRYEALERRILEELEKVKAVAGTDMWRGSHKTFSPQYSPRPTVQDQAALMQWIKDTNQESQLTLPAPRLKSIVCEALDSEFALAMTPAQRAALKPGDPGSMQPPPGVDVFLDTGVHHTTLRTSKPSPKDPDDGPF